MLLLHLVGVLCLLYLHERMGLERLELYSSCCNFSITICQHFISHLLHSEVKIQNSQILNKGLSISWLYNLWNDAAGILSLLRI
jgi:hypothetical protein